MKKKILVIETNLLTLSIIKQTLETAGYEVVAALDGESGLRQFDLCQPDLIILDLMLPKLDGLEVCRRIRFASDAPIIVHTALESPEYMLEAIRVEASDYLVKPVVPPMLQIRVETILKHQTQQEQIRPPWLACVPSPQLEWAV
jgi:DNA-binding response OmpR family regulator